MIHLAMMGIDPSTLEDFTWRVYSHLKKNEDGGSDEIGYSLGFQTKSGQWMVYPISRELLYHTLLRLQVDFDDPEELQLGLMIQPVYQTRQNDFMWIKSLTSPFCEHRITFCDDRFDLAEIGDEEAVRKISICSLLIPKSWESRVSIGFYKNATPTITEIKNGDEELLLYSAVVRKDPALADRIEFGQPDMMNIKLQWLGTEQIFQFKYADPYDEEEM